MEQAAKQVASLHTAAIILAQDGQPGGWVWRFQPKRPVGTMLVVVLDIGTQDLPRWPRPTISSQSRHSARTVRTQRSA